MGTKIKIAYIMPSMAEGGAERFLLDFLKVLDNDKFSPIIILFKNQGHWYQELAQLSLPIFVLEKKSKLGIKNIWEIYQLLKKNSITIVHTQLGADLRGRLAAKLAGVKIIISTEQNINYQETWAQRIVKTITSIWADAIVAISPAVAKDMRQRYLLPQKKCQTIIPNGLPLENFLYKKTATSTTILTVGAVGRLSEQKGFDLLIAAWEKINPDNAQLLIAGTGADKEKLQTQINKANLSKQIKLLGSVKNIQNFYQSLDLFVMPSRWEGQGIAALEAGACGIPIVASQIDGLQEIISDNTAWPINPVTVEKIALTLKEAIKDLGTKKSELKRNNLRNLIITKYSIIKVSEKYEELYLKLWREKYENTASK